MVSTLWIAFVLNKKDGPSPLENDPALLMFEMWPW
jgi:hypothetical protein